MAGSLTCVRLQLPTSASCRAHRWVPTRPPTIPGMLMCCDPPLRVGATWKPQHCAAKHRRCGCWPPPVAQGKTKSFLPPTPQSHKHAPARARLSANRGQPVLLQRADHTRQIERGRSGVPGRPHTSSVATTAQRPAIEAVRCGSRCRCAARKHCEKACVSGACMPSRGDGSLAESSRAVASPREPVDRERQRRAVGDRPETAGTCRPATRIVA